MQFDREAAKRDGYTDQEIDQFLTELQQGGSEPPPPSTIVPDVDQTNSMLATGAGAAMIAAPYAAGAAGLYGAGRILNNQIPKAVEAIRGAVAPATGVKVGPINPTDIAKNTAKVAEIASKSAIKDMALQGLQQGAQGIRAAASAAAPILKGLSGAALMTYSRGLNTGEDELMRRIRAQQDAAMRHGGQQ